MKKGFAIICINLDSAFIFQALCCCGIYGRLGNRIKNVLLPPRRHSRVSIEEPRNKNQGIELNNF